jgi:hypothetical protein
LTDLVTQWRSTWWDTRRDSSNNDDDHGSITFLKAALETATKELEQGMYSLEHQQGGIPKLFLEKKREAERLGLPTGPATTTTRSNTSADKEHNDDDDDDDVVEVLESPPAKKQKTSGDDNNGGSNNASIVVIDISD